MKQQLVVADASPLQYLIQSGAIEAMPHLFVEMVIPSAVYDELHAQQAPPEVRNWFKNPVEWVKVREGRKIEWKMPLDAGESEAIGLAVDLSADVLLIDERLGRKAALEFGAKIMGTVGFIRVAAAEGFLNLEETMDRLRKTNIRLSPDLYEDPPKS